MDQYFSVRLDNGAIAFAHGSGEFEVKKGSNVVFRRDFCLDYGTVAILHGEKAPTDKSREIYQIARLANEQDLAVAEENLAKSRNTFRTVVGQVEQLKLDMKMLNCHYSLDGKLAVFQFTADGRVDFRELVKDLSRLLGCRIELRQIGVRDEAAICGGIGICGEELCCRRFLKEFNSINVRMAKDQDLSLTPGTISGACGRLKCCLKFEHAGYVELERSMPRRGDQVVCECGKGRVVDRNLLTGVLSVQMDSGNVVCCKRNELKSIVTGKNRQAKEPEISDDLKNLE